MLRRRASSFAAHHRHASPPSRSGGGGRSSRHSPPPSSSVRHADFRSAAGPSSSFRVRFPPSTPRGIGYRPYRPRAPPSLNPRFARSSAHYRVSPPRPSFRAAVPRRGAGGRFAAVRGGRPPPPRIPYHCRMDISPRRSPCRSRSRSPVDAGGAARPRHSSASSAIRHRSPSLPLAERGRGGGRRPIYRRGGPPGSSRQVSDRSKFIGNFGRPINHPPAYEVSPDRTAPPPPDPTVAADAEHGNGPAAGDGPVVVPSVAPNVPAIVAEELPSNRDELFARMKEAKNSGNLDEYYRLRDALNAFDKRNPHLAYRGSGAVMVTQQQKPRRKRSRSEDMHKEEPEDDDEEDEEEEEATARKRKRSEEAEEEKAPRSSDGGNEEKQQRSNNNNHNIHRHKREQHHHREAAATARSNSGGKTATTKTPPAAPEKRKMKPPKKHAADDDHDSVKGENAATDDVMRSGAAAAAADEAEAAAAAHGLEEVDSVGKQFDWEGGEDEEEDDVELGFDLVENDHLDHGNDADDDDETVVVAVLMQNDDEADNGGGGDESVAEHEQQPQQQNGHDHQQLQQQKVTQSSLSVANSTGHDATAATNEHQREDLWAPFSHLAVSEQLRLLRARIAELECQQQQQQLNREEEANGVPKSAATAERSTTTNNDDDNSNAAEVGAGAKEVSGA